MASTKEDLKRLRAKKADLTEALAEKVALKEELEERIAKKRKAKEKHADDAKRLEELQAQLDTLNAEWRRTKERIAVLEPALAKVRKRFRRLRRRLRNRFKPKVVDLGLRGNATARQTYLRGTVGHYTAGPLDDDGDEESFALWRSYHRAHQAQGWAAIGYNWGVTRDGTVAILRGREYVGAHTLNNNTGWDGCSMHGTTGHTMSPEQACAFRWALKHFGTYEKPVFGHKEMPGQSTACPGAFLPLYKSKGA